VIVLDFTKFGQVDEGNVHCFIVSVLSGNTNTRTGFLYNYLLQYFNLIFSDKDWKPKVCYYDYYAQSTEKAPVKQVFPYVKVYRYTLHFIIINICRLLCYNYTILENWILGLRESLLQMVGLDTSKYIKHNIGCQNGALN
jgi:hypothetical protein